MAIRHVLYVEDDARAAANLVGIVATLALPILVHVVESATRALEFIGQRGRYTGATIVSLIALDLGLHLVSGHELMQGLKHDPIYSAIPVIVYTRSQSEGDRYLAQYHGAEYLVKAPHGPDLAAVVRLISARAHGDDGHADITEDPPA